MDEHNVAALASAWQKQAEAARAAYAAGRDAEAVALASTLLASAPGCLPVLQLLVAAARRLHPSGPVGLAVRLRLQVGGWLARGDRVRAVRLAEAVLGAAPRHAAAFAVLTRAALDLGWRETAVYAAAEWRALAPGELAALVAAGEALLLAGRAGEAAAAAEQALRLAPLHPAAEALLRRSAVSATITAGRWDRAGDSRDERRAAR